MTKIFKMFTCGSFSSCGGGGGRDWSEITALGGSSMGLVRRLRGMCSGSGSSSLSKSKPSSLLGAANNRHFRYYKESIQNTEKKKQSIFRFRKGRQPKLINK